MNGDNSTGDAGVAAPADPSAASQTSDADKQEPVMPPALANGLATAQPSHGMPAQPMDTTHSSAEAGTAEDRAPVAGDSASTPQQPARHRAVAGSPGGSPDPAALGDPDVSNWGAGGDGQAQQPAMPSAWDNIISELSPRHESAADVMADTAEADAAEDAVLADADAGADATHEAAAAGADDQAQPSGGAAADGGGVAGMDADAADMAAPADAPEEAAGDSAALSDMQPAAMQTDDGSRDSSDHQQPAATSDSDDDVPIGARSAVVDVDTGTGAASGSDAPETGGAVATAGADSGAAAAAASDDDSDDQPLSLRTAVLDAAASAQSSEPPSPVAAPAKRQRTDSAQRGSSGSPSPGPQSSTGSGQSRGGSGRPGSSGASKPVRPGSSGKKTYTLPKIKRSERCGHCHTCVNPQLKQACLTVRARMEAEARARGEASPPVSAGFAAAAKRAGSSLAPEGPEPDTPFYRGLKAILGRSGGVESEKRVASLEKLMAHHAKDLEQRKLLVRVIDLSSGAAKTALADGGAVATIGSWLLEAATAGKAKFAADLLACLDGLPIGMKALRATGIGKTVQKVRKMPVEALHKPAAALVAKWKKGLEAEKPAAAEPGGRESGGGSGGADAAAAAAKRPRDGTATEPAAKRPRPQDSTATQEGGAKRVSVVSDDHDMFAAAAQPRQPTAPLRKVQTGGVKVLDTEPRMAASGGAGTPPAADAAGNGPSPRGMPRGRTQLGPGLDPFGAAAAAARAAASEPPSVPPAPTSDDEDDAKAARGDGGPQPTAATAAAIGRPKTPTTSITSIGTTRIGGIATGLGSLPSSVAMSQWASGAAGRAAEAAARVPSPPPAPRKVKAKKISWVADEALAHVRFFNKDDAPVAVRANAEWAAGDEAAPAAGAEEAPPPGFESAARQEHLSEAAALRGRALAGGASDIEEVDPQQALNERFQAMRPTMPWAPPPPTDLADPQWAAGEDSLETHEEAMRQRLRPRAPSNGEAAEPPVYPPDMRPNVPPRCMIPLHVPAAAAAAAGAAAQPQQAPQPPPPQQQQPPVGQLSPQQHHVPRLQQQQQPAPQMQQHQPPPQQQPAVLPAGLPPALAQLQQLLPQVSQAAGPSAQRPPQPPQQQQQPFVPPQQRPPAAGIGRPPQQQRFLPQGGPPQQGPPQQRPPFAGQQQQQTPGGMPYRPVLGPDGRPLGAPPPQQPGRGFGGRGGSGAIPLQGGRSGGGSGTLAGRGVPPAAAGGVGDGFPPQGGLPPGIGNPGRGGPGRGGPVAGRGGIPPQGGVAGAGAAPGPPFTGHGPSPPVQQQQQQQWPPAQPQQQPRPPPPHGLPGPPQRPPPQQPGLPPGTLPGPPQQQQPQQQHGRFGGRDAHDGRNGRGPVPSDYGASTDHRGGGGGGGRGPQGPRNAPMVDPATGRRICLFFLTPEGCRKGDACRFAHVRAAVPQDELDHALGAISGGGRGSGRGGGGRRGPPPPRSGDGRGGRGPNELRRGVDARFL